MIITTNPQAAYLAHRKEIDQAIATVLDSGWYILGQQVSAFEAEFARYLGAGFAVTTASGTDGIELALRACGIGEGDVVITVSHTAVATVAAIERCGALPVLIDIDPDTYTMDPQRLEHAIQSVEGTARAIIPVHLYGHPADMAAINDIAQLHDLLVIEDCAQAHGATIGGQKVGTFGDMAAFSFYPTKNLGALGDGGCVVTSNESLCHKARALREYGWQDRYISAEPGINSRLDELQAAVLRVKLRYLDQNNARRGEIAQIYHDQLIATDLVLPRVQPDCTHVYHQFVVQSE